MSLSADGDNNFHKVIVILLAGNVVCQQTEEALYDYLQIPERAQDVADYLGRIDRTLRTTGDSAGYFAAYRTLNHGAAKMAIRGQFREAINVLGPMVSWLRTVSLSGVSGGVLRPGDTLRESELLAAIESAPAQQEELDRLSRTPGVLHNTNRDPRKQLSAILQKLCQEGYLVAQGASGAVYVATGKWSRLYDILEFIVTHERLDEDEDVPEQQDLLGAFSEPTKVDAP